MSGHSQLDIKDFSLLNHIRYRTVKKKFKASNSTIFY